MFQLVFPDFVYASEQEAQNTLETLEEVPLMGKDFAFNRGGCREFTNVNKLAANLVAECKLDIVFRGYTEANQMVVERWVNKALVVYKEKGLRTKHQVMVKSRFMALIFVPSIDEINSKRLFATSVVQDRIAQGEARLWRIKCDSSTWFIPRIRREVEIRRS
jgi:hypothetical protein